MNLVLAMVLVTSWVQVRSDAFVVKSPVGEERALEVLEELETFYQLVGRHAFQNIRIPELPLDVLILEPHEMERLGPLYEGEAISVEGYYQKGIDRDYIVLSSDLTRGSTRIIQHELAHYLISRALESPPTWLNEGLGEYFASAVISGNTMTVGQTPRERVNLLIAGPLLPLSELFDVDPTSPHYNEQDKANLFYSEAWALVHYLKHGPYAEQFQIYQEELRRHDVELMDFLPVTIRDLEVELAGYLRHGIHSRSLVNFEGDVEIAHSRTEAIDRAWVDVSVGEMLLSTGRDEEAAMYLAAAAGNDAVRPRVAYSRGIMSRMVGSYQEAREHFVDALIDDDMGPLAAFHLVQMGEGRIPEVLSTLERASHERTRDPLVYLALSEIYLNELQQIRELVLLAAGRPTSPPSAGTSLSQPSSRSEPSSTATAALTYYASGSDEYLEYELASDSDDGPRIRSLVRPIYPEELRRGGVAGEVTVDVQISDRGEVIGLWLISARPNIFSGLATSAVRQWQFDGRAQKVRVVIRFRP